MSLKNKYSFLERLNLNNLYNTFLGLPPQQQTLALIASCVILVLLVLMPISLASNKIGSLEKQLSKNRQEMGNIVFEIDDYNKTKSRLEAIEGALKGGYDKSLSTTLETMAGSNGIQEGIESIKERPVVPSELFDESIVEVRISKLTLQQLVDFIYAIENEKTKLLRVKDIRIKTRFDNKQLLDVSFNVSTFKLPQEG